jgi:hypothetical protein
MNSKFQHKKSVFIQMINIQLSAFNIIELLSNSKPKEFIAEAESMTNKAHKEAKSARSWDALAKPIFDYNKSLVDIDQRIELEKKIE